MERTEMSPYTGIAYQPDPPPQQTPPRDNGNGGDHHGGDHHGGDDGLLGHLLGHDGLLGLGDHGGLLGLGGQDGLLGGLFGHGGNGDLLDIDLNIRLDLLDLGHGC
jgi:hypothetical protein